jgi:hypothetical protein
VGTLQKAAQMALADKSNGDPVFKFARAVKAFELTVDARLQEKELPGAFNVWWSMAESILPPDTDRIESALGVQWVNDAGKWVNRIKTHFGKTERVTAEVESAVKESRIKTTPAQYAEQIWKEFAA